MYKLMTDKYGYESIRRIEDGANIPLDPNNTDYQAYLKWLEEGNTPTPADEGVA